MHRELNEPEEIRRRLLFVIYLACWCVAITSGIISIAQGRPLLLIISLLSGLCVLLLKKQGTRAWQFDRLSRSFPYGDPEDQVSASLRLQAERIFQQFHQNADWEKRLELRRELAELVNKYPEILHAYRQEISAVDPKLGSSPNHP